MVSWGEPSKLSPIGWLVLRRGDVIGLCGPRAERVHHLVELGLGFGRGRGSELLGHREFKLGRSRRLNYHQFVQLWNHGREVGS